MPALFGFLWWIAIPAGLTGLGLASIMGFINKRAWHRQRMLELEVEMKQAEMALFKAKTRCGKCGSEIGLDHEHKGEQDGQSISEAGDGSGILWGASQLMQYAIKLIFAYEHWPPPRKTSELPIRPTKLVTMSPYKEWRERGRCFVTPARL